MAVHDLDLGELWIDRPDALEKLAGLKLPEQAHADVEHFIRFGYVIFEGCVDAAVIDQVVADTQRIFSEPERYVVRKGTYVDPVGIRELDLGHRIIDLYAISPAARDAAFAARAAAFYEIIFGEPAIGIQSLSFEYGSQQSIHQDTAYVVSIKPLALLAAWLALEDVSPGTGELMFYPGGHRFPHQLFSGQYKAWTPKRDGQEAHQRYLESLHELAKAQNIEAKRFLPRKGDVLIWHADLPHGGSRITQRKKTRRSLVTHFVPHSVKANYRNVLATQYGELRHSSGHWFSSRHFDLRKLDERGSAPILYDAGVSRARAASQSAASSHPAMP